MNMLTALIKSTFVVIAVLLAIPIIFFLTPILMIVGIIIGIFLFWYAVYQLFMLPDDE